MITTKRTHIIAAIIAFAYIGIQGFQYFIITGAPAAHSTTERFLQTASTINLWRAALLMLSFWGLLYVFLVVCLQNLKQNFTATVFAFVGFFIFCLLEIGIRSVELFYYQTHLVDLYRQAAGTSEQQAIIEQVSHFYGIQIALYFPLLFSQLIGSFLLTITFDRRIKWNYLIIFAFGLNAIRKIIRISRMFLDIDWIGSFNIHIYFVCTVIIYGAIGVWLLRINSEAKLNFKIWRQLS